MPVCLLLIRHAESLANLEGFFSGHMDGALSPRGHQQSRYAADVRKDPGRTGWD